MRWGGLSILWGCFSLKIRLLRCTIPPGCPSSKECQKITPPATLPYEHQTCAPTCRRTRCIANLSSHKATWLQAVHQRQFGFHRFRMLTVTTSTKRVTSLIQVCRKLEQGHGLFLFADLYSLKGQSFSKIWNTCREETGLPRFWTDLPNMTY